MKNLKWILPILVLTGIVACTQGDNPSEPKAFVFHEKLSDYGFFKGDPAGLSPVPSVFPYELNSTLFSDYTHKARFIQLPEGEVMQYQGAGLPEFPVGTILIKNFFYLLDEQKTDGPRRLIETRLLVRDVSEWKAGTYIWNDAQTDAIYELLGQKKDINWIDKKGQVQKVAYQIPDANDCKSCHKYQGQVMPIGPKIQNLHVDLERGNQLKAWAEAGNIQALPTDLDQIKKLPNWEDPHASLDNRARAYLDINCGHCHNDHGPANNTALNLNIEEQDPHKLGIFKGPVSAAQGSGDLRFDIVPGAAEASILYYRMSRPETGIAMPEIGKSLVHTEGLELIRDWIDQMDDGLGSE